MDISRGQRPRIQRQRISRPGGAREVLAMLFCLALFAGSFNAIALVDNAALLSNSIPDGASVMPKTMFTQTWTFQNTGTSTWTPDRLATR